MKEEIEGLKKVKKILLVFMGVFNIGFSLKLGEGINLFFGRHIAHRIIPLLIGCIMICLGVTTLYKLINELNGRVIENRLARFYAFWQTFYLTICFYMGCYEEFFSSALSKERSGLFVILTQIISWATWIVIEVIIIYDKNQDREYESKAASITRNMRIGNTLIFYFAGYFILATILNLTLFSHMPRFKYAMSDLLLAIIGVEGCIRMFKSRKRAA